MAKESARPLKPPTAPARRVSVSAPKPNVEYETVLLQYRHTINNDAFGPGPVRVERDIARTLLEQESRQSALARRMFMPRTAIIGGKGQLIEVPADFFDDPGNWTRMPVVRGDGKLA